MSSFPRVRPPGTWIFGSALAPSEVEEFDDHQSKAINGDGGGTWAPSSPIVLGATGPNDTGLHVTAILQADQLNATVPFGMEIDVDGVIAILSGGFLRTLVGATATFNDRAIISATGSLHVQNGGQGLVEPGGTLTIQGVPGTAGLLEVQDHGLFHLDLGSSTIIAGLVTGVAGSALNLGGTNTLSGTNVLSGTNTLSGPNTLSGTNVLSGATAQTGPYGKVGASATTSFRWTTVDPASGTYNSTPGLLYLPTVTDHDEYSIVSSGDIVMPDPTGIPVGTEVRFYIKMIASVQCSFLPFFVAPGSLPARFFQLNPSAASPISQGLGQISVSFRVRGGPAWEVGPGSEGPFGV